MTVEERAQQMLEEIPNQKPWEGKEELKAKFVQHLRAQIEDCAKVAKRYEDEEAEAARMFGRNQQPIPQATHAVMSVICGRIKDEIRTLAAPKEDNNQEKGD